MSLPPGKYTVPPPNLNVPPPGIPPVVPKEIPPPTLYRPPPPFVVPAVPPPGKPSQFLPVNTLPPLHLPPPRFPPPINTFSAPPPFPPPSHIPPPPKDVAQLPPWFNQKSTATKFDEPSDQTRYEDRQFPATTTHVGRGESSHHRYSSERSHSSHEREKHHRIPPSNFPRSQSSPGRDHQYRESLERVPHRREPSERGSHYRESLERGSHCRESLERRSHHRGPSPGRESHHRYSPGRHRESSEHRRIHELERRERYLRESRHRSRSRSPSYHSHRSRSPTAHSHHHRTRSPSHHYREIDRERERERYYREKHLREKYADRDRIEYERRKAEARRYSPHRDHRSQSRFDPRDERRSHHLSPSHRRHTPPRESHSRSRARDLSPRRRDPEKPLTDREKILEEFRKNYCKTGEDFIEKLEKWSRDHHDEEQQPDGVLTTSWGKPVTWEEANNGLNPNTSLIADHYLFETMTSFTRERLAPRAGHPKGAGAHGYFEVTHDVSWITDVDHFNEVGKNTPIFMRFSPTTGEKGSPELRERNKGASIKWYTKNGIMDVAGFNINAFALKDPFLANVFIHTLKPNPKTRLRDINMVFDFVSYVPSALHATMLPFTALGQPRSYGSMPGHALHTYQVQNSSGHVNFIKINWFPDEGIQNLTNAELASLQSQPDYHTIELYDRIAAGNFPSYTLAFQVIPASDVDKTPFDITDITLNWPADEYPNHPVGKLVLNKNPENYQAEVEMSCFNPGNLPLGIWGLDKIFEARIFIYKEGCLNRVGSGANEIPINCPLNAVKTYNRDGAAPVDDNGGGAPNYYPNSFNGPQPFNKTYAPLYRPDTEPGATNFWLVKKYINDLSPYDFDIWLANIALTTNSLIPIVKERILKVWNDVDPKIHDQIVDYINKATASG